MMKHEHFIQECFKAIFLNISGATDSLKSLSNSAKTYRNFLNSRTTNVKLALSLKIGIITRRNILEL